MEHAGIRQSFIGTALLKKPISTDEGCINPERSEQIAFEDTQELSQSLAQMALHSPVMCTPVPADRINGQIVMDL